MDAASVALRRMTAAEIDAILAAERAAADHVSLAVATARAHEQIRQLMPRRVGRGVAPEP